MCPFLNPSVCRSVPPAWSLSDPWSAHPVLVSTPCSRRCGSRTRWLLLVLSAKGAPVGGFLATGESTPNLGPGIFTSDSGDWSDTHTSAAKQQVLAGLLSIDLCPSGLCRHSQRRSEPSQPRAPTPAHTCTKASRAVLEKATSSNRRRTASRAVSLSTVCRRGCVTASGGG